MWISRDRLGPTLTSQSDYRQPAPRRCSAAHNGYQFADGSRRPGIGVCRVGENVESSCDWAYDLNMTSPSVPTPTKPSVHVLTRRVDLRSIFPHEETFTQWLATDGWSEFCASLGIDASSVDVRHQAFTASGRIADVVAAEDEEGNYSAVIEAQLGPADHDHARRLVADYMGEFHPGVGVLLCGRWSASVEAILSNSLRPVLGVEVIAHALAENDYVLAFTVVHRHDPQSVFSVPTSVHTDTGRIWVADDAEFARLVAECCDRGVTAVPAIVRDLHLQGYQAGTRRVLRFIPDPFLPPDIVRPTDPSERRYIASDDEFREAVLDVAEETDLTKVWQSRHALNDRLIQASHRRIATVLGLEGDSGEWDVQSAVQRIRDERLRAADGAQPLVLDGPPDDHEDQRASPLDPRSPSAL